MNHPQPLSAVTIHPAPGRLAPSAEYTATVDGVPLHVYRQLGFAGGTVSWISFDSDRPVEVRVTAQRNTGRGQRFIDRVDVLPSSAGATVQLEGTSTVVVQVPCASRLTLRFDDDWHLPFHIFANPLEKDPPSPSDPSVVYFGPGEHDAGLIRLGPGQTLYLAGGAVVDGIVRAEDADGARIRGRGILRGSKIPHGGTADLPAPMVKFSRCRDAGIEGVTLLDSFAWTLVADHCDRWRAANIKLLSERGWSTDGINPCNSSRVVIEDCFVRCKDDCVAVKGLEAQADAASWTPMDDIAVRRCVFWSDNNNVMVIGAENRAQSIRGVRFQDIDIIKVPYTCGDDAGALAITCLDDTVIEDVLFERIRIAYCYGPVINFFFAEEIFGIPGSRRMAGGILRRIVVRDVSVEGGVRRRSFIRGLDPLRRVEDVVIENLRWAGLAAATPTDARLVIEHAHGVTIR